MEIRKRIPLVTFQAQRVAVHKSSQELELSVQVDNELFTDLNEDTNLLIKVALKEEFWYDAED